MAAGDLLKIVINQSLQASTVQNVLYYLVVTDPAVGSNIDNLNADFTSEIIISRWKTLVSDEVLFTCNDVQKVFPDGEEAVKQFPTNIQGDKNAESLPATDCVLMQKVNSTLAGVGKKGRMYIAGLPEDDTQFGRMLATVQGVWESLAILLQDELAVPNSGTYKPAWATRSTAEGTPIDGFVEIDVVNLKPRIASQRRRRTPVQTFVS